MYYSSKIWEKSSWSVSRHRMDTKEEYVQAIIDSMSNFGSSEAVMAEFFLGCDEESSSNWGGNSDDYIEYVRTLSPKGTVAIAGGNPPSFVCFSHNITDCGNHFFSNSLLSSSKNSCCCL